VVELERDGNQIPGLVRGSTHYPVLIELNEGGIESLYCECPHFAGGTTVST